MSWWESQDLVHMLGQCFQVHPPHETPIHFHQVGEQELTLGQVLWGGGGPVVGGGEPPCEVWGCLFPSQVPAHNTIRAPVCYLDNSAELLIGQFSGRGAGHLIWDVYSPHGCHVGREVRAGCGLHWADVHSNQAFHQLWLCERIRLGTDLLAGILGLRQSSQILNLAIQGLNESQGPQRMGGSPI